MNSSIGSSVRLYWKDEMLIENVGLLSFSATGIGGKKPEEDAEMILLWFSGELGERRKFVGRENGKYIAAEDAIGFNEREEIPVGGINYGIWGTHIMTIFQKK